MSTPPLFAWNVYSADRHLVATYSTQAAAASHVASWPASYYVHEPVPASTIDSLTGIALGSEAPS